MARRYYRRKKNSDISQLIIALVIIFGAGAFISQIIPSFLSTQSIVLPIIYILSFIVIVVGGILLIAIVKREQKRLRALSIADIDHMTGVQFEQYVGELLKFQGYHITYTPGSGDYGTDIVAKKGDIVYGVQVKCYSSPVGVHAIQEAVSSLPVYQCTHAMAVTNNTFTRAAKTLAEYYHCILIDRKELADWIIAFQNKRNTS